MNKRGITRTIELLISILIISTVIIIALKQQNNYNEVIYGDKINRILEEIANTPNLRSEVFDPSDTFEFYINERMNEIGLSNSEYVLCTVSGFCRFSQNVQNLETNIYTSDWVYFTNNIDGDNRRRRLILVGWNE